jgi:hypothetical protein
MIRLIRRSIWTEERKRAAVEAASQSNKRVSDTPIEERDHVYQRWLNYESSHASCDASTALNLARHFFWQVSRSGQLYRSELWHEEVEPRSLGELKDVSLVDRFFKRIVQNDGSLYDIDEWPWRSASFGGNAEMHFVRCIDSDSLSPIVFHDINDCGQLVYAHSLTAPLDIAKMKLMAGDVLVHPVGDDGQVFGTFANSLLTQLADVFDFSLLSAEERSQ